MKLTFGCLTEQNLVLAARELTGTWLCWCYANLLSPEASSACGWCGLSSITHDPKTVMIGVENSMTN